MASFKQYKQKYTSSSFLISRLESRRRKVCWTSLDIAVGVVCVIKMTGEDVTPRCISPLYKHLEEHIHSWKAAPRDGRCGGWRVTADLEEKSLETTTVF